MAGPRTDEWRSLLFPVASLLSNVCSGSSHAQDDLLPFSLKKEGRCTGLMSHFSASVPFAAFCMPGGLHLPKRQKKQGCEEGSSQGALHVAFSAHKQIKIRRAHLNASVSWDGS